MPDDSDHDALHADELMRAATQKLRGLGWPPPAVGDESGGGVAATDDGPDDQRDGVDDGRENRD